MGKMAPQHQAWLWATRLATHLGAMMGRFAYDRRGGIAVTFALTFIPMILAVGAGLDLASAYVARQQLSGVARLTCQYANRPIIVSQVFGSAPANYATSVNSYAAVEIAAQKVTWTQTVASPFTYAVGGAGTVALGANVPTTLMQVVGVANMPVSVSQQCFAHLAGAPQQPVADSTATLVNEGFENASHDPITWYLPTGTSIGYDGIGSISATNTPPANAGYVGSNGNEWIIMGYCLEVDKVNKTVTTVSPADPTGTHSAELDCDNGSNTAGNSSISTKVYMTAANYELRWSYAARILNTNYDPAYICGSTAADTSWANDPNYSAGKTTYGSRTNQINVYLDRDTTGSPPTHTPQDGTTNLLGGSNLIDECVYGSDSGGSADWIERSVTITVATAGYYWLSFAADGASDSFGGQIDAIELCLGTCSGSVPNYFPSDWLAVNNSGSNKKLFEDTFESPTYTAYSGNVTPSGNLNTSLGTSGSASGWPNQATSGWATGPDNDVMFVLAAAYQGSQSIQLDNGWTYQGNKLASRPFLLVPGYYKVTYAYVATLQFTTLSGTYCGATPTAANLSALSGTGAATYRSGITGTVSGNQARDTNIIGLFLSHAQLASTPIGGGALNSTTSYLNPSGTTTTTPTVPPNGVSLTSYNAAQVNPLIDICGYAQSWTPRTVYFRIVKPAYYWLTMAGLGTSDGQGGSIDDITLTALDGPYMSGAPTAFVTIPVPDPQPLTSSGGSFTGFSITYESKYK